MLQFKDNKIITNITLFYENESNPIFELLKLLKSFNLDKVLPTPNQALYSRSYSFIHLILFHFLGAENINQYKTGAFNKFIENGKDVFYRMCANPAIDWRGLAYKINKKLLARANAENLPGLTPKCFIVDDSDLEKQGRKIEFIGRVWSHVSNSSILGFKFLNLCIWDGFSLTALDFSLHMEMGKNKSRPQGVKPRHLKERFSKERPDGGHGAQRAKELTVSKIEMAITMIKRARKKGIEARYVVMDSWFCCEKIIRFVYSATKMDLICRAKMGTSKYLYKGDELSAKELLTKFKYRRDIRKYSRKLKTNYLFLSAHFKGIPVRLLFIQTGRNKWILIISTDLRASAIKIVETYQVRWAIEVFFKEAKQHLGLGKCHANDFDAQIAGTTLTIIRYNLLSAIKSRSENFSIGTLFRAFNQSVPNPSIVDKIVQLFYKLQKVVSDLFEIDVEYFLQKIFSSDKFSKVDKNLLTLLCSFETCET